MSRGDNTIDMTVDRSWRDEQRKDAERWHEEWERDRAGVVVIDKPTHDMTNKEQAHGKEDDEAGEGEQGV